MTVGQFVPQVLPAGTRSLAGGVPPAPQGTIFALAADGGFAVPLRRFTLHFGRDKDDVHVPIGIDDPYISRLAGIFVCDGREWWIRNKGTLPIQFPGDTLLLSGHELPIEPGYTPLLIGSGNGRSHLLELHVVGSRTGKTDQAQRGRTKPPEVYDLSLTERLVLTALAQRYLCQEPYPQPLSWKQVTDELNGAPEHRQWTQKSVAHIVGAVRERLATGTRPISGIRRDDGVAEPVGNTLNHNLIQALLRSATLMPSDLHLLGPVDE